VADVKLPKTEGGFSAIAEFMERGNLFWDFGISIAPGIISKLFGDSKSFVDLLVLTAPLTISAAFLVYIYMRVKMSYWQGILLAGVTLAGLGFLAQIVGQGTHLHWEDDFQTVSKGNPIPAIALLPYVFLFDYFNIYGAGPFFLSVATGGVWAFLRVAKQKKHEEEIEVIVNKNLTEFREVMPGLEGKIAKGEDVSAAKAFVTRLLAENGGSIKRAAAATGVSERLFEPYVEMLGLKKVGK